VCCSYSDLWNVQLSETVVVTNVKCPINPITNPNPVYSHSRDNKIIIITTIVSNFTSWNSPLAFTPNLTFKKHRVLLVDCI
jgi:hypothetical protein